MDNRTASNFTLPLTTQHNSLQQGPIVVQDQQQYLKPAPQLFPARPIIRQAQDFSLSPSTEMVVERAVTSARANPHLTNPDSTRSVNPSENQRASGTQKQDTGLPAELVSVVIELTQNPEYIFHGSMALLMQEFNVLPNDIDLFCTMESATNLKKSLMKKFSPVVNTIPGIEPLAIPEQINIRLHHARYPKNPLKIQLNILTEEEIKAIKTREYLAAKFDHSGTVYIESLEEKVKKSTDNNHQFTTKYLQEGFHKNIPTPIIRSLLFNNESSDEARQFSVMIRALMAAHESLKTLCIVEQNPDQATGLCSAERIDELRQSREGLLISLRNQNRFNEFLSAIKDRSATMPVTMDFAKQLIEPINTEHPEFTRNATGSPSIQVSELLSLKQTTDTGIRKHPAVLELLYLNNFKLDKPKRSHLSKAQLRTKLKECREKLDQFGLNVKTPNEKDLKRLLNPNYILTRPTSTADIHSCSQRLLYYAAIKNPELFQQRARLITSLAAEFSRQKTSQEEYEILKSGVFTSAGKNLTEALATHDQWYVETILMLFFPNLKPSMHKVSAPFLRPAQALYCRANLSNHEVMKKVPQIFKSEEVNLDDLRNCDAQIFKLLGAIHTLQLCLDKKLNNIVSNTVACPPDTFSKRCIKDHILFTCDLVHKIILLPLAMHTPNIDSELLWALYSYLGIISTMRNHIQSFPNEHLMLTETLCFVLQSNTIQNLLSKQETETRKNIKTLLSETLKKLECTILSTLKTPLQSQDHLSIFMCLLKTICNHKMFLTAQDGNHKERISQLAIIVTHMAEQLLSLVRQGDLQITPEYSQLVHRIHSVCTPLLKEVCTSVVQVKIPELSATKGLIETVNSLSEECQNKLNNIEHIYQNYLKELEKSEREYNKKILNIYQDKKRQIDQKQALRIESQRHLHDNMTRKITEKLEGSKFASDYAKLVNTTGDILKQLAIQLECCEDEVSLNDILNNADHQLSVIEKFPVLRVWAYGDQAYSLWQPHTDQFNRAGRFVEHFKNMKEFCTKARDEAIARPKQYDSKWLHKKNPEQPISLQNLYFLTRLYDPQEIPKLIKRAGYSVSLYEKALQQASNASHQLTQSMMVDPENSEHHHQKHHLEQRIAFIINEMNQIKQFMEELHPIPDMQDFLKTRKELFRNLQTQTATTTKDQPTSDSERMLQALSANWKPDQSVFEGQRSAVQRLDQAIVGFIALKTLLEKDDSQVTAKHNECCQ
ncbi:hypothetical protein [Endozoicomonas sp. SCSIO W0465]|uniref:hypothetical protein n=1 Tax=Endozoicomonas sp. SCSIO W0465 TaxID=2918516 RepID=UPI002075B5C3|nr:hypothetical protein [Endozoicomonas sp. SCSIO W0465]USE37289.1 hypothetical protein MJO57_03420 [Endozoicomonas sp. SCSIO W0465]